MIKNKFDWIELITTTTRLDNSPTSFEHFYNLIRLSDMLNQLRDKFNQPIYVNSAYRTKEVNEKVGGVINSKHMIGKAADITSSNNTKLEFILKEHNIKYIKYDTFFHVEIS